MICKSCGAEVLDSYNVCTNCGARLEKEVFNAELPVDKKEKPAKILTIVSFILAAISFFTGWFCIGTFTAIAGLICGIIAIVMAEKKTMPIIATIANPVACVLGWLTVFLIYCILVFVFGVAMSIPYM